MAQTTEVQRGDDQVNNSENDSRRTIRYDLHEGDPKPSASYGATRTRRSCSRDAFGTRSSFTHTNPANGIFDESYTTTSSEYAAQSAAEIPSLDHTRVCTLSVFTDELMWDDIQCLIYDSFAGHLRKFRNRNCTRVADRNLPGAYCTSSCGRDDLGNGMTCLYRDAITKPMVTRMFAYRVYHSSLIVDDQLVMDGYKCEGNIAPTVARMRSSVLRKIVAT